MFHVYTAAIDKQDLQQKSDLKTIQCGFSSKSLPTFFAEYIKSFESWPGGATMFLYMVASPLNYAVYSLHGHCNALLQRPRSIFTARKRNLGQGNIFTLVCHSIHRGGVTYSLEGTCCRRYLLPGSGSGVPGGDPPPERLLLRAVRILLEFIL